MKTIKIFMMMAVLTSLWACSSDDATPWKGSTFVTSAKPTWAIDWTSNATTPNWQDPDATKFECSMDLLIDLEDEIVPLSTDGDMMAVFIDGECRGVSYRNVMSSGRINFLLHVKGSSEEDGTPMELRYYCDGVHHLTISEAISCFVPNNLMDKTYQLVLEMGNESTKYPTTTMMSLTMPKQLPFTPSDNDMLAVFVGDECRGIGSQNAELYEGWRMMVYGVRVGESAQIRYYSAEQGRVYTLTKPYTLNGEIVVDELQF